jgi:hypothetical protein
MSRQLPIVLRAINAAIVSSFVRQRPIHGGGAGGGIAAPTFALKLIGQLARPRCVVDSHRVAGEVGLLAYRLDQRDV